MKFLSPIFFLITLVCMTFLAAKTVTAVTCESVSIEPPSGDINTEFVFTAIGCVDEPEDFVPDLRIEFENTESGFWSTITPTRLAGDPYSLTANIGGFIDTGTFNIGLIQYRGQDIADATLIGFTSFVITASVNDPDPGVTPTISCGLPCTPGGGLNDCSLCPIWCDAARVTNSEGIVEWRCTVDYPMICGGANGPGIKSAIGCIPFETPNATTIFFLTWGLGVGGGIALLILVMGTYKLMLSKGDPEKLQEGKEMIGAAIAGIVLIVLSAFFVRIVIFDILQLL